MLPRLLSFLTIVFFALLLAKPGMAAGLEVTNITVSTQAENAVKARDVAINKAQRLAFATIVGKNDADLARITDVQIARLVRGFSVQGERLTSRSYRANFTIRFSTAATNNFALSNGLQLTPAAAGGQSIAFDNNAAAAIAAATAAAPATMENDTTPAPEEAAATQSIVVLPILDIGSRRVVWDEPNPWRDVWQESDHSTPAVKVTIPVGDVDDVTDIADASFLNGGTANIGHMLGRYGAANLYVVIAKNLGAVMDTAGGMSISLYRHDSRELKFIRKMVIHPRPGYLFNDAVPAAMQMIAANNPNSNTTVNPKIQESQTEPTAAPIASENINGALTVTVPYQSLQQWVAIQRRLRNVAGVRAVMPIRVSASAAQVKIITANTTTDDLSRNLALQQFILQKMSNGEMVLVEQ